MLKVLSKGPWEDCYPVCSCKGVPMTPRHTNQNWQCLKILPILNVKILFPQRRNNFFSNFLKLECTHPSKEVYTNVHSNFVCNSQKLGFTHMFGNGWIVKQTWIYPHTRGPPIDKKEGTHNTYYMPICRIFQPAA